MGYVKGNSTTVRKLQELLKMTMDKIEEDVSDLDKSKKAVVAAWRDAGVEDVEESIKEITSAIEEAKERQDNVNKALEAYADFLESIGK